MYLYSIFSYIWLYKKYWMPCWVHDFWSLIFNTHGNWGCESNRPYVSGGVLIPFPSTLCRHSLRSAMSPFLLVQVLPLEEHGFGPQTSSSSPWKFHEALPLLLKIYDLLKLELKTTGNGYISHLWTRKIAFGWGHVMVSREDHWLGDLLKKMRKGMAWGLSRNTEAQIILTSNLAMATATNIKARTKQQNFTDVNDAWWYCIMIIFAWFIIHDTVLLSIMIYHSWNYSSMILFIIVSPPGK